MSQVTAVTLSDGTVVNTFPHPIDGELVARAFTELFAQIQRQAADIAENDAIIDQLRAEQAARATPAGHISQARDAEYRALLGLQSSVEESVRNGLMDVSVEQSLATVQATQSASPEAAPK